MKILVVSDSHGTERNIDKMLKKEGMPDMLLHLGDVCGGEDYIEAVCDCPVVMVAGNNDYYNGNLLQETVVSAEGKRIFMTHGHYYGLYGGYDSLVSRAKAESAEIVMFGHTHRPVLLSLQGVVVLNPGSITYPRQQGRRCSYGVMEVSREGTCKFDIRYL